MRHIADGRTGRLSDSPAALAAVHARTALEADLTATALLLRAAPGLEAPGCDQHAERRCVRPSAAEMRPEPAAALTAEW